MSEQREVPQDSITPNIIINENLSSRDCPYRVEVGKEGIIKLLQATGISEDKLDKTRIEITRKPSLKDIPAQIPNMLHKLLGVKGIAGSYNPINNHIKIYTDAYWENADLKKAESILKKREQNPTETIDNQNKNLFPQMKSGKRLSLYLTVVPPERGRAMVKKLFSQHSSRRSTQALVHEIDHLEQGKSALYKELITRIGTYGGTIAGLEAIFRLSYSSVGLDPEAANIVAPLIAIPLSSYMSYWFFSSAEKKARETEKNNTEYKLITLTENQKP